MSVPDNELWWWKVENKPDKTHCDRNDCTKKATQQVAWRHMDMRHIACDVHADWWIQRSREHGVVASVTAWVPA